MGLDPIPAGSRAGVYALEDHVRASLRMARLLLDEVLDARFSADDSSAHAKLASKAGGEMAMLLRVARRALHSDSDLALVDGLAHDLAPLARSPQMRRSLLLRPSRAPMYSLAHLCLTELGHPDPEVDRLARRALRSSVCWANERVPYRILDAAWTRHVAFGDDELHHAALTMSPLGTGVDLLEATTEDAYAFTHALPYATDFGRLPLPDNVDRQMLLQTAEAIAVKALDEDDLDLLAEVLMAPAVLRAEWTPVLTFAWRVLERVWIEHGFVPGPGLPAAPAQESRVQEVRRVLGTVYHTTFAAGLCAATLISCNRRPTAFKPQDARQTELPPGKGSEWKTNWRTSSDEEREALNFISLAFRLRRAVETADFVQVRTVTLEAAETLLMEHALFLQSLELLERVGDLTH